MKITLERLEVGSDHKAWSWIRALYAIAITTLREIVYFGKTDGCTVRERWKCQGSKADFWSWYERQCDRPAT